jgi:hypothetical protein
MSSHRDIAPAMLGAPSRERTNADDDDDDDDNVVV